MLLLIFQAIYSRDGTITYQMLC